MIRFAVVGTNWITDHFIEAAQQLNSFHLEAIYSRTEEKAKEFADKYDVETVYTSIEELARNKNVDAIYIASPNVLHKEQAIMFMQHGKHVLCEKPLASNYAEVEEMVKAANENNVLLMEALKTTSLPNFAAIKDHLHKIGTVRRFFASYCQYSSRYDAYKEGTVLNAFKPELSNGALMDIGIYCVYPLVALFGQPTSISAMGFKLETGVDGQGSLLLGYENMDAVLMYSKITNSYVPSEIQGEEGCIIIDKIHTPEKVEIRYNDGRIEDITRPQDTASMYYEAKAFIEACMEKRSQVDTNKHEYSLTTAAILEEARKQIGVTYPADK